MFGRLLAHVTRLLAPLLASAAIPTAAAQFALAPAEGEHLDVLLPGGKPTGARWSAYRDCGRFGRFTVVELARGNACAFRYRFRFRIIRGPAPARDELEQHYQRYLNDS